MKIGLALRELHHAETELVRDLLRASGRHRVDHEIYHVGRELAEWSKRHVREVAEIGVDYGVRLDPECHGEPTLIDAARDAASELIGRRSEASLLLLHDLREVYVKAAGVLIDWDLIGQAAQGIRRRELVELAGRCHAETLRQMNWAEGKIKESATQILVS